MRWVFEQGLGVGGGENVNGGSLWQEFSIRKELQV